MKPQNQNAAKPERDKLSGSKATVLKVRCFKSEIQDWKREARTSKDANGKRLKLSEWVRETLNEAALERRMMRNVPQLLRFARNPAKPA